MEKINLTQSSLTTPYLDDFNGREKQDNNIEHLIKLIEEPSTRKAYLKDSILLAEHATPFSPIVSSILGTATFINEFAKGIALPNLVMGINKEFFEPSLPDQALKLFLGSRYGNVKALATSIIPRFVTDWFFGSSLDESILPVCGRLYLTINRFSLNSLEPANLGYQICINHASTSRETIFFYRCIIAMINQTNSFFYDSFHIAGLKIRKWIPLSIGAAIWAKYKISQVFNEVHTAEEKNKTKLITQLTTVYEKIGKRLETQPEKLAILKANRILLEDNLKELNEKVLPDDERRRIVDLLF